MLAPSQLPTAYPDPDAAIRLTDSDAAIARLSAVKRKYLDDPYIKHLVPRAHLQPPRPPLINLGTYVRSAAIDRLVHQWFQLSEHEGKSCQIVSLGAGSDTRFWRLATSPFKERLASYVELDFPEITSRKVMAITKSRDMSVVLGSGNEVKIVHGGTALHSPVYHLLPVDLRLPPSQTLPLLLSGSVPGESSGSAQRLILSPSLPTLLIFECVLVYMSPSASSKLIQWFVDYFSTPSAGEQTVFTAASNGGILGAIVYEMFGLGDAFGRVMVDNLKVRAIGRQSRNVDLPGAKPYHSLSTLPSRFLDHGFTTARALTLREIRRAYIEPAELERTSMLEMLDEVEELDLVLGHYAVTWGIKIPSQGHLSPAKAKWSEWGMTPQTRAESDVEDG